MDLVTSLLSLGVATGAGLLVGLEREQSQPDSDQRFGGVRTFAILGLLGGLSGLLQPALGWHLPALVLGLVGALMMIFDYHQQRLRGLTTEIAGLAVLLLGVLAATPVEGLEPELRWLVVASAAVALLTLLSVRRPLHTLAGRVSSEDLYAAAKLGTLLVIVLPLLPGEGLGPQGRINPFEIGFFVALIAGVGFAGYVSVRILGASRGMVMTALFGGLASSTAVTLNFAGRAKEVPALVPLAALGVVLANALVFPRMMLEVSVTDPSLVIPAAVSIGGMGAVAALVSGVLYLRRRATDEAGSEVALRNPFSLAEALKFGALYTAVKLVAGFASDTFGDAGVLLAAALAGLTDVDAITLSVAALFREGAVDQALAVQALVVAAVSNMVLKAVMAAWLGGARFGRWVGGLFLPIIIAGGLTLLI